jgi:hypothetical protein
MSKRSGELLDIELLRPHLWVASMGAKEGSDIDLDLPELSAVGKARVLSVGPCPDINPGEGRVVTGTFAHPPSERIIDVCLAGSEVPISCTENHHFWSEDRGQFVPAGNLQTGEQVRSADGSTSTVTSISDHPGSRRVFNLEVHVEHVYLVSTIGVVVHNMCEAQPPSAPKKTAPQGVTKATSPQWKSFEPFRGKTKTNGLGGKKRQYYEWDYTHGDIEGYDTRGKHLGSMDPTTGEMIKPAVPGRKIDI